MLMSAYDRWKTAPPVYRLQSGDCRQCGAQTEWVTGRALLARQVLRTPKKLRSAALDRLIPDIADGESYCAYCGGEAQYVKFVPCSCGAKSPWHCLCP